MRLVGCLGWSIVVICYVVRYSSGWKKRKRRGKKGKKKKGKKITRGDASIHPIWRGKREENDFSSSSSYFSIEKKKIRAKERECKGREREKEAAARRVH